MLKVSKNQNFENFGPLIEHGSHWINFTILTFINENNRLKAYIKIETKLFHLTWKKKVKCKTCHGKNEEKAEFGSPYSEFLGFKCGIPIMFGFKQLFFKLYILFIR
jgi:hypothetical protein